MGVNEKIKRKITDIKKRQTRSNNDRQSPRISPNMFIKPIEFQTF